MERLHCTLAYKYNQWAQAVDGERARSRREELMKVGGKGEGSTGEAGGWRGDGRGAKSTQNKLHSSLCALEA